MADFFDKLKQGLGKGVTTVSAKSKEWVEATKVKTEIDQLKQQKKDAIEELGHIVYAMLKNDKFDLEKVNLKYARIAQIDQEIKNKEDELEEIHVKTQQTLGKPITSGFCPQCGNGVTQGAKFCAKCGHKIEEA
ncbi:MAG: zinc ribbon domain-containing protein [Firmicutes bacterium]|nr:zinc ribbon domain-containing protein [Bacillota bacterium]